MFQIMYLPITILILLQGIQAEHRSGSEITRLDKNPGIYFEELEPVFFEEANWKMIVYLDLAQNSHQNLLANAYQKMTTTCPVKELPGQCKGMLRMARHILSKLSNSQKRLEDLVEDIEEIKDSKEEPQALKGYAKRDAPYAFLGKLAKPIFGILTEDEGKYYEKRIREMQESQNKIAGLTTEKLHFVEKTLGKTQEELERLANSLNYHLGLINNTWKHIDELSAGYEILLYLSYAQAAVAEIELEIEESDQNYNKIAEIVNFAKIGMIHPELISRTTLREVIKGIEKEQSNHQLPLNSTNARTDRLSGIADIKLGYQNKKVIFELTIPLIEKYPMRVYRIHKLPVPQEEEHHTIAAYIETDKEIIATSHDNKQYTYMAANELTNCKKSYNFLVCKHQRVFANFEEKPSCEVLMLIAPSNANYAQCPLTIEKNFDTKWIYLQTMGEWLYSSATPTQVTIKCPDQKLELTYIQGMGIMRLQEGCSATQGENFFFASPGNINKPHFIYQPQLMLNLKKIDMDIVTKGEYVRYAGGNVGPNIIIRDTILGELNHKFASVAQKNYKDETQDVMILGTSGFALIGSLLSIAILIIRRMKKRQGLVAINDPEHQREETDPLRPLQQIKQ